MVNEEKQLDLIGSNARSQSQCVRTPAYGWDSSPEISPAKLLNKAEDDTGKPGHKNSHEHEQHSNLTDGSGVLRKAPNINPLCGAAEGESM